MRSHCDRLRRHLRSCGGQTSAEYIGVILIVGAVIAGIFATSLGATISDEIRAAICQISGGDCEAETAQEPDRCLESSTTTSSHGAILVAVVKVDKDSTLIREDYSDGSSRFIILDNSEIAGEVFAGVKGKIDKYGVNYSASADAGLALAGAQVFDVDNREDADKFQKAVEASGGFDGILRDLASYDDEIPIIGWDNPLGGINDAVLDFVGVDRDDLPEPDETYMTGEAYVQGNLGAGAGGLTGVSAEIEALLKGAGAVKVVTGGDNAGDVELSIELSGEINAALSEEMLGVAAGGTATGSFTATLHLDAQNGLQPDKLEIKGSAGYTGTLDLGPDFNATDLEGLTDQLESLSLTSSTGEGKGLEVGAELDLDDPVNRAAALALLTSRGSPSAVAALVERFDKDGTLSLDTFDQSSEETDGEVKVGLGPGVGIGGGTSTDSMSGRDGIVRPPGGTFEPRVCATPPGG